MKRLVSLALSMALILSLAACASTAPQPSQSAPQESQTVSDESPMGDLSVTYDLSVGQMGTGIKAAMVVLAHEMGYYEEEGLNVELTQISNLNDGLTAITLGKLDVLPFGVIPTWPSSAAPSPRAAPAWPCPSGRRNSRTSRTSQARRWPVSGLRPAT